jgi:predicted DCC family thiol-disulfide oxidoreductase YuxK
MWRWKNEGDLVTEIAAEQSAAVSAPVWLFDGHCIFCSRSVLFVLRHETTPLMRFVAIQSGEGRSIAQRHGIDPDDPNSSLFIENGVAHAKSDGVAALIAHLRRPWSFVSLLTALPRPLRDWLYDRLARNRYRLMGKRASCMAAPPELRARFVIPEGRP